MMAGFRPARAAELIQSELATMLLRELKDPRLSMATVSRVDVSPDLRQARLYVSRMGTEEEREEALRGFERAAGFIRGQLGKRLKLKSIPKLTFVLDTGIAYGVRISRLLNELVPAQPQTDSDSDMSHA